MEGEGEVAWEPKSRPPPPPASPAEKTASQIWQVGNKNLLHDQPPSQSVGIGEGTQAPSKINDEFKSRPPPVGGGNRGTHSTGPKVRPRKISELQLSGI